MVVSNQRETLLRLWKENADERGRVRLTTKEMERLTGIPEHDVAKRAWEISKLQKIRFRETKRGGSTRGRTRSVLSDFQLMPAAWEDGQERVDTAIKTLQEREDFGRLVRSITPAEVLDRLLPAALTAEPEPVWPEINIVEWAPKFSSTEFGDGRRNMEAPVGAIGWAQVRVNGSIRQGYLMKVSGTQATIRDVSGNRRSGELVKTWRTPPENVKLTPRMRRPNKTFVSKAPQPTAGPVEIPALAPTGVAVRDQRNEVIENPFLEVSPTPPAPAAEPERVEPVVDNSITISRRQFPLIARAVERESLLLQAVEALDRAGLHTEAERILSENALPTDPVEAEIISFVQQIGASLGE